jgi:PleD family two-component response regulator
VSIGVACREPTDASATELVLRADDRLYRAKRTRDAVYPDLLLVAQEDGVTSAAGS